MKINLLVGEIGSTTTVVNAFDKLDSSPVFIGQGQAPTSVLEGDVNIGLKSAIADLKEKLSVESISYDELVATSSAAGGLRMTVHGLVYDMTVKAAKEAALGAGANIKNVTAGKLRESNLKKIREINPNIILLAGGVDYGERDTALHNAEIIAGMNLNIPIIYAGNIENREEIREIFEGKDLELHIVDNVYPRIDELNIEPTRKVIQDVFERHIIHAPGMGRINEIVTGSIMPTPGAVMESSKLLYKDIGNLVAIDVGGATTDVHSVTDDSENVGNILISPEPKAKRTVEGDLGVYLNMENIITSLGQEVVTETLNIKPEEAESLIKNHKPIPKTKLDEKFVESLTSYATLTAIKRHAGNIKFIYGPSGKKTVAEGKDLTDVKYIIGTGGALSNLKNNKEILEEVSSSNVGTSLLPSKEAEILIDNHYIMASLGVMSKKHPEAALELLKNSFKEE